jgi:ABC-type polysaccharide/polyol phosphate transport system ATPase subunit
MDIINRDPAVIVSKVSKVFNQYNTQWDRVREALHPRRKVYHQEFWALNEVSLEIPKGETFGIMGRNGSGKSTLLKLIAGIMHPSGGRVQLRGRVSSLLELGAGFNPEFTGRENVTLNSAIHGFTKSEIIERLPEIEAFANIEEFFNQPVKTYSSGMFVRLAFAAAINVNPDILIVDEALAVGDATFQQRCFQKFRQFQAAGVTIILVSHDNELILRNCQSAALLERGHLVAVGEPKSVASRYTDLLEGRTNLATILDETNVQNVGTVEREKNTANAPVADIERRNFFEECTATDRSPTRGNYNDGEIVHAHSAAAIVDHMIIVGDHTNPRHVLSGDILDVYFKVFFHEPLAGPCYGLSVKTTEGVTVYALNSHWTGTSCQNIAGKGCSIIRFRLPAIFNSGAYFLDFGVDKDIGDSYEPITRRMFIVQLEVHASHIFHGLVDAKADFEEISTLS